MHGLNRSPANQKHQPHAQRWQRYEKPQQGHHLQMDLKFLERIPGTRERFFQFTAIDDCTRIRVLKVFDAPAPAQVPYLPFARTRAWLRDARSIATC